MPLHSATFYMKPTLPKFVLDEFVSLQEKYETPCGVSFIWREMVVLRDSWDQFGDGEDKVIYYAADPPPDEEECVAMCIEEEGEPTQITWFKLKYGEYIANESYSVHDDD